MSRRASKFGAGLLSSFGELALETQSRIEEFQIDRVLDSHTIRTDYQRVLFVVRIVQRE